MNYVLQILGQDKHVLFIRDHERFVDVYFKPYPGYYFTGDGCEIKENGYHWITGRVVRYKNCE